MSLEISRFRAAFLALASLVAPAVHAQKNGMEEEDSTVRDVGDVVLVVLPLTVLAATFIAKDGTWQFVKSLGLGVAVCASPWTSFLAVTNCAHRGIGGTS